MNTRNLMGACALSLMALSAPAFAQQTTTVTTAPNGDTIIRVSVDNEDIAFADNARPRMIGGRVMVPLRGVVERLGGRVLYDAASKVVTGAHAASGNQFRLRVGKDEALLNGQQMAIDAPPRVIAGTTYVPLRFVSEAMGAKVKWDNAAHTVVILGSDGNTAEVKP